jgi:hypothetical protein
MLKERSNIFLGAYQSGPQPAIRSTFQILQLQIAHQIEFTNEIRSNLTGSQRKPEFDRIREGGVLFQYAGFDLRTAG